MTLRIIATPFGFCRRSFALCAGFNPVERVLVNEPLRETLPCACGPRRKCAPATFHDRIRAPPLEPPRRAAATGPGSCARNRKPRLCGETSGWQHTARKVLA
jgi:hypothetical protein